MVFIEGTYRVSHCLFFFTVLGCIGDDLGMILLCVGVVFVLPFMFLVCFRNVFGMSWGMFFG